MGFLSGVRRLVGGLLRRPIPPAQDLTPFVREGTDPYPHYVEEARKLGMDVNDYFEKVVGNGPVIPLLELVAFPYLVKDGVTVELGPATGVYSREFLPRLGNGTLHLVDYSPWFVRFLTQYFRADPRVKVHQTGGMTLPAELGARADLVVSLGTFVMLKLGLVYSYAHEFFRVLKPGGHFVIEYIDISSFQGWTWLESHSSELEPASTYTYFTPEIMEAVFADAGFEPVFHGFAPGFESDHPWMFLVGRKPTASFAGP